MKKKKRKNEVNEDESSVWKRGKCDTVVIFDDEDGVPRFQVDVGLFGVLVCDE